LKYVHYLIINESEAENLSGLKIRKDDNSIDKENLIEAGKFLIAKGVRELVVIHFPEGGFAIDINLNVSHVDSFTVRKEEIKSSVGAGDAFCAAMLYALHEEWNIKDGLILANASARFNLFDSTATGGAKSLEVIKEYINSVGSLI
jgi:sugar/nucleoside kinase (ribokinase family)